LLLSESVWSSIQTVWEKDPDRRTHGSRAAGIYRATAGNNVQDLCGVAGEGDNIG
jgi:hypothetical protein